MPMGTIDGVMIAPLVRHTDDRGSFAEILRVGDPFFQEGGGQSTHPRYSQA